MPAFQTDAYAFLGNAWSLWSPHDDLTGLNIVSGARQAVQAILSVCLIRKGEDPIHPDFGLAPDLFVPLTDADPEYWVYHLEQEIVRWVAGIQKLQVKVSGYNNVENQMMAEIGFLLRSEPTIHVLTFPYYQYQGAVFDGEIAPFLAAVQLDGQPFSRLA